MIDDFEKRFEAMMAPPLTENTVSDDMGFTLASKLDGTKVNDPEAIAALHREVNHFVDRFGRSNVFGSLYQDGNDLVFGVFVRSEDLAATLAQDPGDDDGLAGDREPRNPMPLDDFDSAAIASSA